MRAHIKTICSKLSVNNRTKAADRIQPQDTAVFHGTLDLKKLNLIEKWMVNKVKAPIGDFRDWHMIDTWAEAITEELLKKTA